MYTEVEQSIAYRMQKSADVIQALNGTPSFEHFVDKQRRSGDVTTTIDGLAFEWSTFKLTVQVATNAEHFYIDKTFLPFFDAAFTNVPDNIVFDESRLISTSGWLDLRNAKAALKMGTANGGEYDVLIWSKFILAKYKKPAYLLAFLDFSDPTQVQWAQSCVVLEGDKYVPTKEHGENHKVDQVIIRNAAIILHLLGMRVSHKTEQSARANLANAARAKGYPATAKLITLRRPTQQHVEGAQDIEWNCQWHVRGHWRQQPYRSTGQVRPVFIEAYIKGPADKPLKPLSHNIFVAKR